MVLFSVVFVANTKINFCYDFIAPLIQTFESLKAVHGNLDLTEILLQISMDGGSRVNWKTIKIIKEHRKRVYPDAPDTMVHNVRTIGIIVVRNVFF